MSPHLIIFDCDGTLVDSQDVIAAAMTQAFTGEGLTPPGREAVRAVIGLSLPEAFDMLVPHVKPRARDRLIANYRGAFGTLRRDPEHDEPLFPGARETLEALAAHDDILLGIATGKSRRGVAHFLERHGLEGMFATIQTADTAPSKPHPAMIDQAMADAGADPTGTVMIGDTTFDIQMARNAGVMGIGVAWGYHAPGTLTEAGAAHVAHDFDDLRAAIDRAMPPVRAAS